MKNYKLWQLIGFLLLCCFAIAPTETMAESITAASGLENGSWTFSFYKAGAGNKLTSSFTVCGGGESWGLAGPIRLGFSGSGGFGIDGNDIFVFGQLNEHAKLITLSAYGRLVGERLITGNYLNTISPGTARDDIEYGVFEAVYQGLACPL